MGVYTATVTAENSTNTLTATTQVTIAPPLTPVDVTISGAASGWLGEQLDFTATVQPASAGLPLTYHWEASGQQPITHTGGIIDTVSFTWETLGTQHITVTASRLRLGGG